MGAFDDAASGTSAMLLVGGDAGVGKSRLVEHAVGLAGEREMTVLSGGCIELGGTSLPFAPIREAVRDLVASRGAIDPGDPARQLAEAFTQTNLDADVRERIGVSEPVGQAQLFEFVVGASSPPRRRRAATHRDRRHSLGRSVDSRPPPVHRPQQKAHSFRGDGDVPLGRAPPAASAEAGARRAATKCRREPARCAAFG